MHFRSFLDSIMTNLLAFEVFACIQCLLQNYPHWGVYVCMLCGVCMQQAYSAQASMS